MDSTVMPTFPTQSTRFRHEEKYIVDRLKGVYMMMVMGLTDGTGNEICIITTHLHPHTEKLGQFMKKLNSESQ